MNTKHTRQRLGKETAIALYESGWWKDLPARKVAEFQLFTEELCMPFGEFQQAMQTALGRPVWTHEFGLNYDGLCDEFLGEKLAPSFAEIMDLIPEEKRILVRVWP